MVDRLSTLFNKMHQSRLRDLKGLLNCSMPLVFSFSCAIKLSKNHQSIWNPYIPSRVGFLAWEASQGKVLTLNKLTRRGRALANMCFLCEEKEETTDHLLLHYIRTRILWELFFLLSAYVGCHPIQFGRLFLLGKESVWVKSEKGMNGSSPVSFLDHMACKEQGGL